MCILSNSKIYYTAGYKIIISISGQLNIRITFKYRNVLYFFKAITFI